LAFQRFLLIGIKVVRLLLQLLLRLLVQPLCLRCLVGRQTLRASYEHGEYPGLLITCCSALQGTPRCWLSPITSALLALAAACIYLVSCSKTL